MPPTPLNHRILRQLLIEPPNPGKILDNSGGMPQPQPRVYEPPPMYFSPPREETWAPLENDPGWDEYVSTPGSEFYNPPPKAPYSPHKLLQPHEPFPAGRAYLAKGMSSIPGEIDPRVLRQLLNAQGGLGASTAQGRAPLSAPPALPDEQFNALVEEALRTGDLSNILRNYPLDETTYLTLSELSGVGPLSSALPKILEMDPITDRKMFGLHDETFGTSMGAEYDQVMSRLQEALGGTPAGGLASNIPSDDLMAILEYAIGQSPTRPEIRPIGGNITPATPAWGAHMEVPDMAPSLTYSLDNTTTNDGRTLPMRPPGYPREGVDGIPVAPITYLGLDEDPKFGFRFPEGSPSFSGTDPIGSAPTYQELQRFLLGGQVAPPTPTPRSPQAQAFIEALSGQRP